MENINNNIMIKNIVTIKNYIKKYDLEILIKYIIIYKTFKLLLPNEIFIICVLKCLKLLITLKSIICSYNIITNIIKNE